MSKWGSRQEVEPGKRLEALWAGEFGDAYTRRNEDVADGRRQLFWSSILDRTDARSILEVGCNIGANLRCLADGARRVEGVDVNVKALRHLKEAVPHATGRVAQARSLPFEDAEFELTFTMGVLIHQPDDCLGQVMDEIVRCSSRFVLGGEYFAPVTEEVRYRDIDGALFKRNYRDLYQERHTALRLIGEGFLGRGDGWDDLTWFLFERETK